jgi:hypothetical protein
MSASSPSLSPDTTATNADALKSSPSPTSSPSLSYKSLIVDPPPEYEYPSQPYFEVPIVLISILVPLFLAGVAPWILLILVVLYPMQMIPLLLVYVGWVALMDSKSPFRGGWENGGVSSLSDPIVGGLVVLGDAFRRFLTCAVL